MTQHRKPEERIHQILSAAAGLIVDHGYASLTMEAVAARCHLSKGGVYRFFHNRRAIALALFQRIYQRTLEFDVEEALSWQLPVQETLFRLLFEPLADADAERERRVFLQLLPETLRDPGFRQQRRRLQRLARQRYGTLLLRMVERDALPVPPDFQERLQSALSLGVALMEGLTLQESSGSRREQRLLLNRFLEVMVTYATEASSESDRSMAAAQAPLRRLSRRA